MLNLCGAPSRNPGGRFCDGLLRRAFLKIGGLGLGAGSLGLGDLLAAEAEHPTAQRTGGRRGQKSLIMIYLPGGPPHQDMFELKMDAPSGVRGEFKPMRTNVPGIEICEHLPRMARMMDKLAVIRSVVGSDGRHDSHQCLTGQRFGGAPPGGWPELGSTASYLNHDGGGGLAPYVNLSPKMQHRPYNAKGPGFLGTAHRAFRPEGDSRLDMELDGITLDRLADRENLFSSLDRFRRRVDRGFAGVDAFQRQALDILSSGKLARALDLDAEDPRVRDRYGKGTPKYQGDAAPRLMEHFLLARRLVEVGVRVVTLSFSFWDWHGQNFNHAKQNFPDLDQGVTALVEDLHLRGLDEDVTVVVWGEFGRTPHINKGAGRDHWPRVSCALLACGGLKTGQAIGRTDRLGGEAVERPVHFQEIFATMYHQLGIDVASATVPDLSGRPRYLVAPGMEPLPELI
jgi:hypothetical protein